MLVNSKDLGSSGDEQIKYLPASLTSETGDDLDIASRGTRELGTEQGLTSTEQLNSQGMASPRSGGKHNFISSNGVGQRLER